MKILCLYNNDCALPLFDWLHDMGHEIVIWKDELSREWILDQSFDLVFSYTYNRIIKKEIIDAVQGNIVNLHTSFLPFNRGADTNMWSLIEKTPRGVTLHYIDEYVDKGAIIYQEIIPVSDKLNATLRSTYSELDMAAHEIFKKAFSFYSYWNEMRKVAIGKGTYHNDKQGKRLREVVDSFEMRIDDFIEKAEEYTEVKKNSNISKEGF